MNELELPDWIDDNIRRAQSIVDDTAPRDSKDYAAPPTQAVALALLALCGVGLLLYRDGGDVDHTAPAASDPNSIEAMAARSKPAIGLGFAVRRSPCGCVVDWVADSAPLDYREATFAGWLGKPGDWRMEQMSYDEAQPLLAAGRGCTHRPTNITGQG